MEIYLEHICMSQISQCGCLYGDYVVISRESISYRRLYRFDQWNDIFRYRPISVYHFGFTVIFYIYMYVCMYVCMCVCVCIIINIKVYHKTLPQFRTNYSWFQTLASIKRKKKHTHTHNIKNRKLNCSLHTKKTNDFNKLILISYHSALTKIQKLQNLKKKKNFFLYRLVRPVPASIAQNQSKWPIHDRYGRYLNRYETLMFRYRHTYRYGIALMNYTDINL